MDIHVKALAINGVLIVISASITGTVLHESAHFLTARYVGVPASLHHNYVWIPENTAAKSGVLIAAAGPLFSLLFGVITVAISRKIGKPALLKLFTLWLGMGSILSFFGYLLIAPIVSNGDTGRVFQYFGFPVYLSIAIAAGSFIYMRYLFAKFANQFVHYSAWQNSSKEENKKQLFLFVIYGSIIGMTLLSLPVVTWVSLLPTLFMPMMYFSTMSAYEKFAVPTGAFVVDKVSVALVILTVLLIMLFRYLV